MSNTMANREAIFIYGFSRLLELFARQLEHYTVYGLVVAIPKRVPILEP